MSELINNREARGQHEGDLSAEHILNAQRQTVLKQLIKELHDGQSIHDVKERFREAVGHISVAEISQLEQALIEEEGIPVSEVQRLCSVHAEMFKGSIDDIHRPAAGAPEEQPGHPVHTFKMENRAIERLVQFTLSLHMDRFRREPGEAQRIQLLEDMNLLYDVDKHYSRKENLLFPFLEKYGIHGPTQVMWGVDDGIRLGLKEIKGLLTGYRKDAAESTIQSVSAEELLGLMERVLQEVTDMIFKEEHILLPMALETLTEDEWLQIARESAEIGYCLVSPEQEWIPERAPEPEMKHPSAAREELGEGGNEENGSLPPLQDGLVRMGTGILSIHQLETMLNHLPVDLTFIDENDVVRYFSHGKERIFARTRAVIGRTVQNCHPPQSVHVVNELLADFKAGRKDAEDFWIPLKDKFVYIRYFAVRDAEGTYMGTLEFTQNIKPIQELSGQKRILS
ncbi:DUF438 domain-containing protein [Paenibacillus bovis]|uniref:PAS domain S-box protein n=1 Tax=Paenibacillus bovis TaxID=1616788 RepID=A0A172ZB74_9BACL|nr:DUF438 domain-containing protein [Paenibacillus bovis]ANF94769.1 PAS domain S-box protein [Paenibacillus bovis]